MWEHSRQAGQRAANTKAVGDAAEDAALAHLRAGGLRLVQRNFRTPGRGGGEIDLIMREPDGTLVFVEVRLRRNQRHGGAAGSITTTKQRRLVFAARHYLLRLAQLPPCRFDVILISPALCDPSGTSDAPAGIQWLRGAFTADGHGATL